MSTLMLKRIGSTMIAGENIAKKMLAWTKEEKETLKDIYSDVSFEDEEVNVDRSDESDIKELTSDEAATLKKLVQVLKVNKDTDPKYLRVRDILKEGADGECGWLDKRCIIFSQYFDEAIAAAKKGLELWKGLKKGLLQQMFI